MTAFVYFSPRWAAARPGLQPRTFTAQAAHIDNVITAFAKSPFQRITAERGFLPTDPVQRLELASHDDAAAEWEAALRDIPKLAVAAGGDRPAAAAAAAGASAGAVSRGALRRALAALPPFPLDKLLLHPSPMTSAGSAGAAGAATADAGVAPGGDSADSFGSSHGSPSDDDSGELWRAYLMLSFLAHAYMWCEPGPPPRSLPAVLAVPWVRVAGAVDMPPVLTYASYNLYNWRLLDPAGPVRLGNIVCLQNFLGGPDEEWFRLVHVEIEARAGRAVAGLEAMQRAAAEGDSDAVLAGLIRIAEALREMQATLGRMGEKCDPYIYYQRVRTPMSGWRNNPDLPQGLVYEGVSSEPMQLYGETGAQSSVLHAFDAALGVQHDQVWLRDYLDTMVLHMPPHHRAFLHRLAAANAGPANVRAFVQRRAAVAAATPPTTSTAAAESTAAAAISGGGGRGGGGELRGAYNAAVEEMERFRSQHRAFAASYIAKWARKEATGTGGSDFMPALTGYRDTTGRHLLV